MVTIPTKPTLTCKLGYYPVAVVAVKGGTLLQGATVKFESWALVIGKKIGIQSATRTTDKLGMAQICFLHRMYGTVSIMHKNNNFGSGVGKYHKIGIITSLQSPRFYRANVVIPTPTPYVPPVTLPTLPPIVPPTLPPIVPPVVPPIVPPMPTSLPTGKLGAIVRLTMMDYFINRPTVVSGQAWGCKGAGRTYCDIVNVTATNNIIEKQESINVGETRKFENGFAVKVVKVYLSRKDTYADVIISPTAIIEPYVPPVVEPYVPPVVEPYVPPVVIPEPTHQRITRILSDGQDLPKAYKGETVRITAESYCVVDGKIDKSSVPSMLLVDGIVADKKPVVGGTVSYEWVATDIPSRHTICVHINPTDSCKSIGKDCKKISVSSTELDISEQLLRERLSAKEQRELIKQSRESLREELISATRDLPSYEAPIPTPIVLPISTPPVTPIIIPIVPPVAPETGSIKLIGIPITIPDDIPAYIYVDDMNKGIINTVPMTLTSIPVGSHSVYVVDGEFKSMTKTVTVTANKTAVVSLL